MSRWPAYPAYKDSGVEWLGEIPAHWETKLLKYLTTCLDGRRIPLNSEERAVRQGPYPYWGANGIVDYIDDWLFDEDLVLLGEDGAPFFDRNKDVAFAVKGKIWVNNHIHVLRVNGDTDFRFLAWCLDIVDYSLFIEGSTRDKLTQGRMNTIPVQHPSLSEQRAIAAFLDRETAKLDGLTGKFERLLELLEERRAALISHAVTKGATHLRHAVEDRLPSTENGPLEGDHPSEVRCTSVEMQDSGIEWLGEIPAHWEIIQVRHVAESLQTGPFGSQLHSSEYIKNGIPVINPSHMEEGCIAPDWEITVDKETWERLERHRLVAGDIVFARRGELGRCALVTDEEDGWLCGTGSLRMRPRSDLVDSPFLNRVFSTRGIAEWLMLQSVGSTMDNLNTSILARLSIPVPPLPEQRAIAAFLDRETARIDALANRVHAALDRLAEYRTALISAAVTGKIDVRGGKVHPSSNASPSPAASGSSH